VQTAASKMRNLRPAGIVRMVQAKTRKVAVES